ncbi:hypothetical protein [Microcoleus sp. herbarium12]|uniref:hypothetical protein n=1 Tax=Microcoleus sp. herbarium12 TaxID=3055437 RepID=UPI002FCFAF6F
MKAKLKIPDRWSQSKISNLKSTDSGCVGYSSVLISQSKSIAHNQNLISAPPLAIE